MGILQSCLQWVTGGKKGNGNSANGYQQVRTQEKPIDRGSGADWAFDEEGDWDDNSHVSILVEKTSHKPTTPKTTKKAERASNWTQVAKKTTPKPLKTDIPLNPIREKELSPTIATTTIITTTTTTIITNNPPTESPATTLPSSSSSGSSASSSDLPPASSLLSLALGVPSPNSSHVTPVSSIRQPSVKEKEKEKEKEDEDFFSDLGMNATYKEVKRVKPPTSSIQNTRISPPNPPPTISNRYSVENLDVEEGSGEAWAEDIPLDLDSEASEGGEDNRKGKKKKQKPKTATKKKGLVIVSETSEESTQGDADNVELDVDLDKI